MITFVAGPYTGAKLCGSSHLIIMLAGREIKFLITDTGAMWLVNPTPQRLIYSLRHENGQLVSGGKINRSRGRRAILVFEEMAGERKVIAVKLRASTEDILITAQLCQPPDGGAVKVADIASGPVRFSWIHDKLVSDGVLY